MIEIVVTLLVLVNLGNVMHGLIMEFDCSNILVPLCITFMTLIMSECAVFGSLLSMSAVTPALFDVDFVTSCYTVTCTLLLVSTTLSAVYVGMNVTGQMHNMEFVVVIMALTMFIAITVVEFSTSSVYFADSFVSCVAMFTISLHCIHVMCGLTAVLLSSSTTVATNASSVPVLCLCSFVYLHFVDVVWLGVMLIVICC